MNKIRVLLVDDHALVRDGIRALIEEEADISVVGQAEDGHAAIRMADELLPDVILMDIAMPRLNGLEATRRISHTHPSIKILVLTVHEDEEYVRHVLACGAMGYILKDSAVRDLICAIRSVHRGQAVLSPAVTRLVIEEYLRWGELPPKPSDCDLSPREREVLQLIAEGYINRQIAEILSISIKTVQTHRNSLMRKLDLHDRGDLIKYAIQKKIIEV